MLDDQPLPRILIVEDCSFNQEALRMMLHQTGHTCDTCDNGEAAVNEVQKRIAFDEEK